MWSGKRDLADGRSGVGLAVVIGALSALGAVVVLAASCSGDATGANPKPITEFGTPVVVGNGNARSYVVLENGTPTELGVALSAAALDSLPTAPQMGGYEYLLPLPVDNPTQYQVVGLNWNPTGHPPPMIYTVPHFDFHFYMTSLAERNAIDPSDPEFGAEAANLPGADFRPSGYVADAPTNAVPHMGLHWTDSTSDEFHGHPFTRTFITGSWNGQFTFFEPMVTRAYLLTHPDEVIPVRTGAQRAIAGYYPAAYRVSWDTASAEWHVALTTLAR